MAAPRIASSLADAVSVVDPGADVAMGGFTIYRRPVALALALADSPAGRDLQIVGNTLSIETEFLLATDSVARIRASMTSLEGFGLAPVFREVVQNGRVELTEDTEALLVLALCATRAQLPFLPWIGLAGSDLLAHRPDLARIPDPYGAGDVLAVGAWAPDVALIHAYEADEHGNVHLGSEACIDVELAEAARTTVVSAERIVAPGELAGPADIWGSAVDVLVQAPHGAFPTSCFPVYPVAGHFLLDWIDEPLPRKELLDEARTVHGLALSGALAT